MNFIPSVVSLALTWLIFWVFTFYMRFDDWLSWWFLWGWVEGFSLHGDWLLPLLSILKSSYWDHFKLMFLFWFWWTLPIDNFILHIINKYRSLFTNSYLKKYLHLWLKQRRHVYVCVPFLKMKIFPPLSLLSLRPFLKGFGLTWNGREFSFHIHV